MEDILDTTKDYPFEDISLQTPQSLQGGTYLAKIVNNDEPIIFQTPKCKTKKGIHKTGKKTYCDLLFTIDDDEFIEWIYSLEQRIQQLIYEKKDYWFVDSDLTLDDIEYNWVSTVKSYKKQHLLRTFVSRNKNFSNNLQVYNNEQKLVSEENITANSNIIGIIEITGLKFSATSFHLELAIKQIMIMKERPKFQKCLIKFKGKSNTSNEDVEEDNEDVEEDDKDVEEDDKDVENEVVEDNEAVEVNDENEDEEEVLLEKPSKDEDDKDKEKTIVETHDDNLDKQEKDTNLVKNEETDLVIVDKNENNQENSKLNENQEIDKEKNILENTKKQENNIDSSIEKALEKQDINDTLVKNNDLDEVVLDLPKTQTTINLKQPNEVYLDIYKAAREKAKAAKKEAIKAYLMAKKIKQTYLLDESEISEDDSDDDFLFSEN